MCFIITLISLDPYLRYFPVLVGRDEEEIRNQVRTMQMLTIGKIWQPFDNFFFLKMEYDLPTRKNTYLRCKL